MRRATLPDMPWAPCGRVLLLVCLAGCGTPRPPAAASQNPSPMRETTRMHSRLVPGDDPGLALRIDSILPAPVEVFVPARVRGTSNIPLLLHFMGAPWVARRAVAAAGVPVIVASTMLGNGSAANARPFADPRVFPRLLEAIARRVAAATGDVTVGDLYLSAWSAGYGAIRALLSDTSLAERPRGILLLDGLHVSYIPERRPLADGGVLDSANLAPFLAFAHRAARGDRRFIITHSEIFPGTFASTTETADWLLAAMGMVRTPVLEWGPAGTQVLSRATRAGFEVLGLAGNTAPDHVDHLHGMGPFVRALLRP